MDFLSYDVNSQIRAEQEKESAERQLREAEREEQLKKIDEEEAARKKKIKDADKSLADFSRIIRFRSRAMNFCDEVHISDDYARFEAADGQRKLTDLEILKILILEHVEKYVTEIEWTQKHPVEYEKLRREFCYRIYETLEAKKRMRTERNDPVADERDTVEICEKFE
ncbi:uncharacterized protein Bfra_009915 [Botrytis fragariae]|uniref:Uncharacterized protein n=1 Tax=Botrytis fragariae TaxID=1964551 RepID=A0A8H6EFN8_9HELO|nr:uncharacterized protein Bfra_009915 [Botrytis fragariae]KAF5870527.1 hypothetical protein Bfra_009915 [Botrytis fragariae]